MNFQSRNKGSSVPEVNLVPMMDVLMSVLTFFIITSMTMTGQRVGDVTIPETEDLGASLVEDTSIQQLVIGLDQNKQIWLQGEVVDEEGLTEAMTTYLAENGEGIVVLKADRELDYKDITLFLENMSKIGGDRVALAVDRVSN